MSFGPIYIEKILKNNLGTPREKVVQLTWNDPVPDAQSSKLKVN